MVRIISLLEFAKPVWKFIIPFFILSAIGSLFGVLNLTLLIPVMQLLFNSSENEPIGGTPTDDGESLAINLKNVFYEQLNSILDTNGPFSSLLFVAIVIIASVMISHTFKYFAGRLEVRFNLKVLKNIRQKVFTKLMGMHLGHFNSRRKSDIISRVTADTPVVQSVISKITITYISEPITLIIFFITLFTLSFKLTIFSIIVIPVMGFSISLLVKKLRKSASTVQQAFAVLLGELDEALNGFRIIKAFNARDYIETKHLREINKFTRFSKKMLYRQRLAKPVNESLGVTMVLSVVLFGGYLVIGDSSELTPEQFIGYIAILTQAISPLKTITGSFAEIRTGTASIDRVMQILDEEVEVKDHPNAKEIYSFNDKIEIKNVDFSYETTKVLKNISFDIPKGKTVALVGPSGSGKTTITDLIPRFYDPHSGSIMLDGIDLKMIKRESISSLMGIVNQQPILFNDTVFQNIAFGLENADPDKVIEAAKIANAHDFIIQLDNGYETNIGDSGGKLSGGQRQRISIARAIMRNPSILILDEATSSLDTESEKLVQDAIQHLMKNRTVLVVAHRLSTIKNADNIIVLENGEIVEQGTHDHLIHKQSGLYKRLKSMQELD